MRREDRDGGEYGKSTRPKSSCTECGKVETAAGTELKGRKEKGERRKEKGERRKEKGERRREKGEGRREKGEGRREKGERRKERV